MSLLNDILNQKYKNRVNIKDIERYREEERKIAEKFKQACFEDLDAKSHPKAERAFELACAYSNDAVNPCLTTAYTYFADLMWLIREN